MLVFNHRNLGSYFIYLINKIILLVCIMYVYNVLKFGGKPDLEDFKNALQKAYMMYFFWWGGQVCGIYG